MHPVDDCLLSVWKFVGGGVNSNIGSYFFPTELVVLCFCVL